ncbi:FAD-binding oxidoreductase [Martelella sp. HB161492]|uniref:FAD-binding oxidoreductase n=1 Tax=Martelella sp. HB161492 TaxID=2720726 RepID=UPI001591CE72|nr:FAD-binding oxidoreductase [Martelella sp. HB161492]
MTDYQQIKAELEGIAIEDNPAMVLRKSRDFYWYSPILKAQLEHVTGDLIVSPENEDELIKVLKVAFKHDAPVTARGGGTGNYGQSMPLSGGIVLDMTKMNRIKLIEPGRVIAEPGIICAELDRQTKAHSGQELRFHPSTTGQATLGGFIAGGSGGVGSVHWGGLRDLGNVLRLRIVTLEAEPRVMELTSLDLLKVSHAYGTNGIITEVEMPLAPAYEWVDVIVGHDSFMDAVRFSDHLASSTGILTKEIAPIAAPVPYNYFTRLKPFLEEGESISVVMVAPHSIEPFKALVEVHGGTIRYRSDTAENTKGVPRAYELGWNHTTLRAMKMEPDNFTYLQVQYPSPGHVAKVQEMCAIFGDEVIGHLEFLRFDGAIQCSGLPLVRYTTPERLEEIIRIHEENGCPVFNPHRYTLEEGGMKQTDERQLEFKKETDPKGLLNPGKMIAWDDPEFDFKAGKNYLFKGITAVTGE